MVRSRFMVVGMGLVACSMLAGCFGTPFDKGDGSGTGTGRPDASQIDAARTGGLGSPRGQELIGPGELSAKDSSAPGVGAK